MNLADSFFQLPILLSKYVIAHLYLVVFLLIMLRILTGKENSYLPIFSFIKWIIVIYSIVTIICWLLVFLLPHSGNYAILDRAIGPYAWAYWIMLFFNCIFPLILFYKPLGKNIYFLLLVSILMNVGFFMERFIIIITSIHRDYLP
ncbi:MAG: NrfD/PsrC family molybdoenzyme membrane anchor subunit [Winogradskyella sp.]|jgi:molybdopterin-containing oxidoreductase family membrane subunit